MGRPSEFTPEIATEICDRLAKGESLRSICADEEGGWIPGETTIRRWLAEGEANAEGPFGEFRRQYALARDAQADTKFDQAWQIAKDATAENVQVARLQIDTIRWQTGKLAPKKYGDKVHNEHTGADGGPLTVVINKPA